MYIVVHCSDSPNSIKLSAKDIHSWHKEQGWDGIGYHFVITRDGVIEAGRPLYWQGAHVRGHNAHSIGICLIGRDEYTSRQMRALERLIRRLKRVYVNSSVVGHYDLDDKKTCPNFDVKQWWKDKNGLR